MANDLFTKEDFIKKRPRNRWFKRVLFILLLIVAVLTIVFGVKKCTTESQLPKDNIIVDSLNNNQNDSEILSIDTLKSKDDIIDSTEIANNQEPNINDDKDVANNLETNKSTVLNLDEKVLSVIRGNYGNNPDRRRKLGAEYQKIQDKVNEMYRNGLVH